MEQQIRPYEENDFPQVLNLLNHACDLDTFTTLLLNEKLNGDPDWDPSLTFVSLDNHRPTGFIQGVMRNVRGEQIGYVKLLAVHPIYRRQHIAQQLYHRLETTLLSRGAQRIRIYDVPKNYLMPGIDPRYTPAVCFAEKMGFSRNGEAINMEVDLRGSDWNVTEEIKSLHAEGIVIGRADVAERQAVLELLEPEWQLWEYEVLTALGNQPRPTLFLARKEKKVGAFAAWDGNNRGTGWFGPMGTHPDLRGKGIGRLLLFLCLKDMADAGHDAAVIPWVGPVSFYSNACDARISRCFWRYEKITAPK